MSTDPRRKGRRAVEGNGLLREETLTANARRFAHDETRLDREMAGGGRISSDPPEEKPHALFAQVFALGVHGREGGIDETPERNVVDSDDGEIVGDGDAERSAGAEKADRDHVVVADD